MKLAAIPMPCHEQEQTHTLDLSMFLCTLKMVFTTEIIGKHDVLLGNDIMLKASFRKQDYAREITVIWDAKTKKI